MTKSKIIIGWLYPELMSTYGDRGNIMVLEKRGQWRGIEVEVVPIDFQSTNKQLESCNLIFGGGAQDRQQGLAIKNLLKKGPILKKMFDNMIPGLFVCGSPQLLGHYFIDGNGNKLQGLDIFDMVTKYPEKNEPRCIGNLIAQLDPKFLSKNDPPSAKYMVGFENHGGRTFLGPGVNPLAKVVEGFGNNGKDQTEGAVYKNVIATYSHGPFLPKNPQIADWLIKTALEVNSGHEVKLKPLNDSLEWLAHDSVLEKFKIK